MRKCAMRFFCAFLPRKVWSVVADRTPGRRVDLGGGVAAGAAAALPVGHPGGAAVGAAAQRVRVRARAGSSVKNVWEEEKR